MKAYTNDATLLSDCSLTHSKVLQQLDQKASSLDLSLKPLKCASCLFDGWVHNIEQGIELSGISLNQSP